MLLHEVGGGLEGDGQRHAASDCQLRLLPTCADGSEWCFAYDLGTHFLIVSRGFCASLYGEFTRAKEQVKVAFLDTLDRPIDALPTLKVPIRNSLNRRTVGWTLLPTGLLLARRNHVLRQDRRRLQRAHTHARESHARTREALLSERGVYFRPPSSEGSTGRKKDRLSPSARWSLFEALSARERATHVETGGVVHLRKAFHEASPRVSILRKRPQSPTPVSRARAGAPSRRARAASRELCSRRPTSAARATYRKTLSSRHVLRLRDTTHHRGAARRRPKQRSIALNLGSSGETMCFDTTTAAMRWYLRGLTALERFISRGTRVRRPSISPASRLLSVAAAALERHRGHLLRAWLQVVELQQLLRFGKMPLRRRGIELYISTLERRLTWPVGCGVGIFRNEPSLPPRYISKPFT